VNPLPDHRPGQQRAAVRTDARLDAATRQKVDDLATRFDRPRAAVLCQIMEWGLSRAQPAHLDQGESPGQVRHLHLYVPSELHEQVEKAATAAGLKTAPWLRHMVRQITITDFPASWQEATPLERSHDSHTHTERFMLRLDDLTREKLKDLSTHFDTSAAKIIRHLIAHATPDAFPKSWHVRAAEHRSRQPHSL
jgi:predicted DNA-binding protein